MRLGLREKEKIKLQKKRKRNCNQYVKKETRETEGNGGRYVIWAEGYFERILLSEKTEDL